MDMKIERKIMCERMNAHAAGVTPGGQGGPGTGGSMTLAKATQEHNLLSAKRRALWARRLWTAHLWRELSAYRPGGHGPCGFFRANARVLWTKEPHVGHDHRRCSDIEFSLEVGAHRPGQSRPSFAFFGRILGLMASMSTNSFLVPSRPLNTCLCASGASNERTRVHKAGR